MTKSAVKVPNIAIIGAGIIGLSCAWELSRRGANVTLFEKNELGRGASWAAAGMLAPAFEAAGAQGTHPRLFELCRQSADLWPEWSKRLECESGYSSGYVDEPTLAVAVNEDELSALLQLKQGLQQHGVTYGDLTPDAAQNYDPSISAAVKAAILLPSDTHVDNRMTLQALIKICEASANIQIKRAEARLTMVGGVFQHEGFDATLITAGWQSAIVKLFENDAAYSLVNADPVLDEIDPYGGQMVSVEKMDTGPRLTLRARDLYIVPKSDRIIIGATVEPGRVSESVDADAIAALLSRAAALCPSLANANVIETWAGVRPGTSNHAPILGETAAGGLYVASGHYRNGILLAPMTAQIMADLILEDQKTPLAASFSPSEYVVSGL